MGVLYFFINIYILLPIVLSIKEMYTNKQTNNIFVQESELAVQYAKALDCRRY